LIGRTISHFRIVEKIGRGGMGVVYKAEDTQLHCTRALKFICPESRDLEQDRTRLLFEARAAAGLQHPNICPVHEIVEQDGETFIAMSFLEGTLLADKIAEGPFGLPATLDLGRQIAEGLQAAHEKGIVHRDIKPGNIMVTSDRRPVIMDFGLAWQEERTRITRTGSLMGTIAYMSPEQAQDGNVDHRTDLWSLGVILFEMVTGRRPFEAGHELALLHAISNARPPLLSSLRPNVPPELESLVEELLAKRPEDRSADAGTVALRLQAIGDLVAQGLVKTTITHRVRRRLRRQPARTWILLASVVLVAAVLAFLKWAPGIQSGAQTIGTIAVLPLEDMTGESGKEYFVDGITDELVTGLARISALTVVSRSAAKKAREQYDTSAEIGRRLGAQALLEGSVQRSGDRVRVSAQLVLAETDQVLWADSYERDLRDIFFLQSEVARSIAGAVQASLTPQEEARFAAPHRVPPEAYEAYLLGLHFEQSIASEPLQTAIGYYERAIAMDPEFSQAHMALGGSLLKLQQMAARPVAEVRERCKGAINRALELDPLNAEALDRLAFVTWNYDWDLKGAEPLYRRAHEINPNLASMGYAQYLNVRGRHKEALAEAKLAVKRDPLNGFLQANLAARYSMLGRFDEAEATLEHAFALGADHWVAHWVLGQNGIQQGRYDAAIRQLAVADSLLGTMGGDLEVKPDLATAYAFAGRSAEAESILADLDARAARGYVPPMFIAIVQAALGRLDEAFAGLERAYDERDWRIYWLRWYPAFVRLWPEPHLVAMARRLDLPVD
jgi:TolB-like protein/predicted Ser/Thr protein kinase/Flp pilus assembly protein TadD